VCCLVDRYSCLSEQPFLSRCLSSDSASNYVDLKKLKEYIKEAWFYSSTRCSCAFLVSYPY